MSESKIITWDQIKRYVGNSPLVEAGYKLPTMNLPPDGVWGLFYGRPFFVRRDSFYIPSELQFNWKWIQSLGDYLSDMIAPHYEA